MTTPAPVTEPTPPLPPPHPGSASPTPIRDYLRSGAPPGRSQDGAYLVLPLAVLASLSPALQYQLTAALAQLHARTATAPWPPAYRVRPAVWVAIEHATETQLTEHGIIVEMDTEGDLRHLDATGAPITDLSRRILVAADVDPVQPLQ